MGFGHRVYRAYDPRAAALRKVAEAMEHKPEWLELAIAVEDVALRVLAEKHPDRAAQDQRRVLRGAGAHGRRPHAGPVPGDVRARPPRRLDRPRHRAGREQPAHPARRQVRRPRVRDRSPRRTGASGRQRAARRSPPRRLDRAWRQARLLAQTGMRLAASVASDLAPHGEHEAAKAAPAAPQGRHAASPSAAPTPCSADDQQAQRAVHERHRQRDPPAALHRLAHDQPPHEQLADAGGEREARRQLGRRDARATPTRAGSPGGPPPTASGSRRARAGHLVAGDRAERAGS